MAYLDSALRQDVTYYDVKGTTGDVLMGLNDDSATIQAAISERVGTFVHHFITFAAGIAIALYRGWELALVMLAVIPLIGVAGALLAKVMTDGARASPPSPLQLSPTPTCALLRAPRHESSSSHEQSIRAKCPQHCRVCCGVPRSLAQIQPAPSRPAGSGWWSRRTIIRCNMCGHRSGPD